MRWAAHEKPALWWSVLIGGAGPLIWVIGVPTRKFLGMERNPTAPYTYPSKHTDVLSFDEAVEAD